MLRLLSLLIGASLLMSTSPALAQESEPTNDFARAQVLSVVRESLEEDANLGERTVQVLRMKMVSGDDEGLEFILENDTLSGDARQRFEEGDTVVVETILKADGNIEYVVKEAYRLPALLWLFGLFLLLAFAIGGFTSLRAVGGLMLSIAILLFIVIPQIINGYDPFAMSLLGCALIACTSLYVAHGFHRRSSVALLSTLLTLGLSALMAFAFVSMSKLFGLGSEEAMFLQLGELATLDLRGLLLGGILIGCLGVLDDITTAQTAAIHEISKANPSLSPAQLRKAGFSVGREHIASLINTLALAYVGASLPLLLLFRIQGDFPLWVTLNAEFLGEEIVRTLVGSATLLFAVPIATWCASVFMKVPSGSRPVPSDGSHSHHHHA